jgi:hypothetical protein
VPIETVAPPLAGFYAQRAVVSGVVVLAHADVSGDAIQECARRIERQLAHAPEIARNLQATGVQMHIIGKDQAVTDLPMYRDMKGKPFAGQLTMDERGRGYGGLYCSCDENNLLRLASDRFHDHRDICSHELAHGILSFGCSPDIREQIETQHKRSLAAGRWPTMYAARNAQEFFAELTMWYFGTRGDYGKLSPAPKPGPAWLKAYDPEAYALLDDLYSGRLKPTPLAVEDLQPLPAESEATIRAGAGTLGTEILFFNHTSRPIHRYWIDFEGKRKSYGSVAPGAVSSISTFASHPWVVTDDADAFLGLYVAGRNIGRVNIGAEPSVAP